MKLKETEMLHEIEVEKLKLSNEKYLLKCDTTIEE
jgi:hypothetical protein